MKFSLKDLCNIAKVYAENMLNTSGDDAPAMTYFLKRDNDSILMAECSFANQEEKDTLISALRSLALLYNVTDYAGYFVAQMTEGVSPDEVRKYGSVSQHPDAFDVLMIHGESGQDGSLTDIYRIEKNKNITTLTEHETNNTGGLYNGPLFKIIPATAGNGEDRVIASQMLREIKKKLPKRCLRFTDVKVMPTESVPGALRLH